jgi:hypothetical protein
MGQSFLDQYSLLHAAVGVLAYFWNIPLWIGTVVHILFEYAENTNWGIGIINRYMIEPGIFGWPGDKRRADTLLNMTGDTVTFVLGWVASWWLDAIARGNT